MLRLPLLLAPAVVLAYVTAAGQRSEDEAGSALGEAQLRAIVEELALAPDARVIVAAGDIARCQALAPAAATAELVEAIVAAAAEALVITTGDHAYEEGTREEFARCYAPTWGRFDAITRPSPGNHDYDTEGAVPYFDYFSYYDGDPAARARGGYYSFDFADWHVVALNSMLPMSEGSAQLAWLADDLRASRAECTLAYWHHPLFSSGYRSVFPWYPGRDTAPVWERLSAHAAEIVVNGHEHFYERYAPQTSGGSRVVAGPRQFTVGTGGGELHWALIDRANREAVYDEGFGVLVLVLEPDRYRWAFIGTDGAIYDRSDGWATCAL